MSPQGIFLNLIITLPRYDPKTDAWTTVAPLSVPRDAVGICPLGDRLYAVGGYDGHTYLATVESYDAQNNEWTEVMATAASETTGALPAARNNSVHIAVTLWLVW